MVMRRSILCNAFSLGRNHRRRNFQQQQQQQQQQRTREKSWKRNSLKNASSLAAFGSRGEGSRSGGDTMGSSILSEKEKKEEKKDDDEDEEVVCYEHDGKNTGDARKLEAWLTQRGINVRETFSPSSSSSALSPSKNENEDTQNGLKSIYRWFAQRDWKRRNCFNLTRDNSRRRHREALVHPPCLGRRRRNNLKIETEQKTRRIRTNAPVRPRAKTRTVFERENHVR